MKRLFLLPLLLTALLLSAGCNDEIVRTLPPTVDTDPEPDEEGVNQNSAFRLYQVDPLVKVVPKASFFPYGNDTLRVARGENAVLQLIVEAKKELLGLTPSLVRLETKTGTTLLAPKFGWAHNVRATNRPNGASDMLRSPDETYPDPIIDDETENLYADERAILWTDIRIPRNATPGLYEGTVRITANAGDQSVSIDHPFCIEVYPVTLPEKQSLTVVNWHSASAVSFLNNGVYVPTDSELYWELMKCLAETAADYGQNCWLLRSPESVHITGLTPDKTDFTLDFAFFDKTIEFLIEHGNLQMITYGHFGGRSGGWNDPFSYNVSYIENGQLKSARVEYDDPRLKQYIDLYFPQLVNHLKSKVLNDGSGRTWFDIYAQHIADEPSGGVNLESWRAAAKLIKEAAPGLRIIEPADGDIEELDIAVPWLNSNIEHFGELPAGKELWIYTCTNPQDNFANRFIHLPLLKTRILHWINYKYNATGYLHWGYNYWYEHDDPLHNNTISSQRWPSGDCYIVYPGYRKVYPSIRLAAMRDGIRDYELLKMVEAEDPAKARAFADEMVQGPDRYNMDIPHFRQQRRKMLELLAR